MDNINSALSAYKPTTVIGGTVAALGSLWFLKALIQDPQGLKRKVLGSLLAGAKFVPGVAGKIDEETNKIVKKLTHELEESMKGEIKFTELPDVGRSHEEIITLLTRWSDMEGVKYRDGKVSGKIYCGREDVSKLIHQVYALYSTTNSLHSDLYFSVRAMDAEIVRMTATMLHGGDDVGGCTTSGGSESLLMAMKTYRDYARNERGIQNPEVIMPVSAHPAFDKAGNYFGIKITRIPVGADFGADVKAMAAAIGPDTIGLVGSAPGYPHGIMDNIPELAKLAKARNLLLHVDGCLGGMIMPWFKELGYPGIPDFDFSVAGVSSISCDTHKYGFGPKGVSTVLFRPKSLRKHMYFVTTEWPGGIYASPAALGSRPGAPLAGTWAVMIMLGKQGYRQFAEGIIDTQKKIKAGLKDVVPEVQLIGDSTSTVLGFQSNQVNILMVSDAMKARNWVLDVLQFPLGFHLCLTVKHIGKAELFLNDLKESVAEVKDKPEQYKKGAAAIYGTAASIPDRSLVSGFVNLYLDAMCDTI